MKDCTSTRRASARCDHLAVLAIGCRRNVVGGGLGQSRRCEPVQGAYNGGDERFATAMASIVEDVKLTGAPPLRQLPRGIQRAADVVAAVDQDAGDAVQHRSITE